MSAIDTSIGSSNSGMSESRTNLTRLVERIRTIAPEFQWRPESDDHSSGGPFANGLLTNEKLTIGLIYRRDSLGLPTYATGDRWCSHDTLIEKLGQRSRQTLFWNDDEFTTWTKLAEGVEAALLADLKIIILPFVRSNDSSGVARAIESACDKDALF